MDKLELIHRRRRQILVHSFIYYRMNTSIISDHQWDMWAKELVELQKKYPKQSKKAPLYKEFKGFDGSTGYDLPMSGKNLEGICKSLINYKPKNVCYSNNAINKYKPKGGTNMLKLLEEIIAKAEEAKALYEEELEEIEDFVEEEEEETFDPSDLKSKGVKELRQIARDLDVFERGMKKDELIEAILGEEDAGDEEDDDDDSYDDWTLVELRTEARDRGIRVTKSMTEEILIDLLEADDEE